MDGFQKRTRAKMDQIESTAVKLLGKPILDFTVTEIAKEANVSPVTIYNYYGSKEALLKEALKRDVQQSLEQFRELLEQPLPFDEKLKQIILMKHQTSNNVHPETYARLLKHDEEMQLFIQHYSREQSIPLFLRFIEEGRACGKVRSSVHNDILLIYLNMFADAISLLSEDSLRSAERAGGLEELLDLFFYGMLNQE
ncbi:TetR/AcrR family transcriptional regulator [Paenibacillus koleovorans]|uniref:TetR/AcrR family transcriptional regulator n=1 Tax=Paenibacillus koleovorans TaxID=121608 RepID=UPI000FD79195|nr:TetR/AcrR family transcriptional regulator [Paenibacillus koleovorans]